ncbi:MULTISPECIES: DUF3048 domain-containing protein [Streptomyces]|uniref:DUF3048 domain-containing protein n=1 Tax=Streptomyces TaxID=1883 RepID=UPI0004CCC3C5|nr:MULTISPECIES: DUF3048 domain-containing protein [Streptomyces]
MAGRRRWGPAGRPAYGGAPRRAVLAAAVAVTAGAALPGCRSQDEGLGGASPFTGQDDGGDHVLAVKVDNVAAARPQTGLDHADIVYTEQVEAGLSRILAVFASDIPATVGPVRSARESDIELLHQFGRPALAFSGAQRKLLPALEAAPLELLPPARLPDGFVRDGGRRAPHNLYLKARTAARAAPAASAPRDIGFRFGDPPGGGRETREETVGYPAARFTFTWSADRGRWLVVMDGTPARTADGGTRLAPATVVIQHVAVRASRFRDRGGSITPFTGTVGSGRARVLRDGKAYEARWSRPGPQQGTTFTDPDGQRLPFARGQVWVALVPED